MTTYVIAVRRGLRSEVGRDWSKTLASIDGLTVVGDANPYRLRIEASDAAIEQARRELSAVCHIEPVQPRYVLAAGSGHGR